MKRACRGTYLQYQNCYGIWYRCSEDGATRLVKDDASNLVVQLSTAVWIAFQYPYIRWLIKTSDASGEWIDDLISHYEYVAVIRMKIAELRIQASADIVSFLLNL